MLFNMELTMNETLQDSSTKKIKYFIFYQYLILNLKKKSSFSSFYISETFFLRISVPQKKKKKSKLNFPPQFGVKMKAEMSEIPEGWEFWILLSSVLYDGNKKEPVRIEVWSKILLSAIDLSGFTLV